MSLYIATQLIGSDIENKQKLTDLEITQDDNEKENTMRAYSEDGKHVEVGSIFCPEMGKLDFKPTHFSDVVYWHQCETPKRVLGQYKLGTASAELKLQSGGGPHYWLQIKFTDLEDGQSLYSLIMSGRIAPLTSYEGEQHVTAIRHFADLWREFVMLVRTSISNKMHRLKMPA